jgi:hypothetical protein
MKLPILLSKATPARSSVSRRQLMQGAGALATAMGWSVLRGRDQLALAAGVDRKYFFAFSAFGGASIIDSFMPVAESMSRNAKTLVTYEDSLIETVGGLRCLKPLIDEVRADARRPPLRFSQRPFLERHGADVAVLQMECTSVSHPVAQLRAMNGGGNADRGRTILETVAERHGVGLPMPIINMTSRGYSTAGTDPSLPGSLRQVPVIDPKSFPLSTHASRSGVRQTDDVLLRRARLAREKAEAASLFSSKHGSTHSLTRWGELRGRTGDIEGADLVSKLMLVGLPGVPAGPDVARVKEYFPSVELDVMEAEAALAFLLAKNGVSSSIAIGSLSVATQELVDGVATPSVYPVEGFDYSHTSHRVSQCVCWARMLRVADGLIRLLKATEDPLRPGTSMWDHSLVYFATDFGRDKVRPVDSKNYGTGHHLNNGVVLVSPLIKGNRVYGGVDPNTALTYGFDRNTGAPKPGSVMTEPEIYGAIAHALDVPFPGRIDMPCLVKKG